MRSINYDEFSKRLKNWLERSEISQSDLVKKSKMSKSKISLICAGKQKPDNEFLDFLSNYSGKNINWWLTGDKKYEIWSSLNRLVEVYFESGLIDEDGNIKDEAKEGVENTLLQMVKNEIKDIAEIKKGQL